MNGVSRFTMGKRLNLIMKGSYETRVYAAGLRFNEKSSWYSPVWKKLTNTDIGEHLQKYIKNCALKEESNKRRADEELNNPQPSKRRKTTSGSEVNKDYGPNVQEATLDEAFVKLESERRTAALQIKDANEQNNIAIETKGQFGNPLYENYRRYRLTASLFGQVVKRRPHTPCHALVKTCLEKSSFKTEATQYGHINEGVAIKRFEDLMNVQIKKSGLWIDLEHGYLGASPDGLLDENAIVEVKCLLNGADKKSLEEYLCTKKISKCLEKLPDGTIGLKRKHNYYYQVQGQLNISGRQKCFFIVHLNDEIPLFVEEIQKDPQFWVTEMLPKLENFYVNCIAPEIVRNNLGKSLKCIDPNYILEAMAKQKEEKAKGKTVKKKHNS